MDNVTIQCRGCGGCGRKPLPRVLREVLDLLSGTAEWTAKTVGRCLDISATCAANRLDLLRANGLVTRERIAQRWRYSVTKSAP